MFAGSMRGPRMKTPLLLLLLLLLTTLTGTGICQDDDGADPQTETEEETVVADVDTELTSEPSDSEATAAPDYFLSDDSKITDEEDCGSGVTVLGNGTFNSNNTDSRKNFGDPDSLGLIIILIPVVLVVMIIGIIVCGIFINRRWNQKARNQELRKDDPYLDGSSTEKVPMPMFEEDVASVLELEMEEFEQWMKKDVEPAENSIHA